MLQACFRKRMSDWDVAVLSSIRKDREIVRTMKGIKCLADNAVQGGAKEKVCVYIFHL